MALVDCYLTTRSSYKLLVIEVVDFVTSVSRVHHASIFFMTSSVTFQWVSLSESWSEHRHSFTASSMCWTFFSMHNFLQQKEKNTREDNCECAGQSCCIKFGENKRNNRKITLRNKYYFFWFLLYEVIRLIVKEYFFKICCMHSWVVMLDNGRISLLFLFQDNLNTTQL